MVQVSFHDTARDAASRANPERPGNIRRSHIQQRRAANVFGEYNNTER